MEEDQKWLRVHIQSLLVHTQFTYLVSMLIFNSKLSVGLVTQEKGHLHQVARVMSKKINFNLPLKKKKWFY